MTPGRIARRHNYSASVGTTAAGWSGSMQEASTIDTLTPFFDIDKAVKSGVAFP